MTNEQRYLVKSSWEKVLPISAQAAEMFYLRLFDIAPEVEILFKGDMRQQGQHLMQMINLAVNELERWNHFVPLVQALGERHMGYGVEAHHYDIVATALLWTLEQGLAEAFTDEVQEAWVAFYTLLADTMKQAAAARAAA